LKKKINLILSGIFCYLFFTNFSFADFQKNLIEKYTNINTLSFEFTQKIGDKTEFGNCHIKYPLLMKCDYPKKKKSIISNGKKFAIVKRRYKKIYRYPLKKTLLFHLLNKENILDVIQNNNPTHLDANIIGYELTDSTSNKVKIFFNKSSLDLLGWKTIDAYSNEVNFLIRNLKKNIIIKDNFFKIPKEEDL
tara:strand:- start:148 stop:723 length:576 start_codon:yes stop_codon:yes gene_type:complete